MTMRESVGGPTGGQEIRSEGRSPEWSRHGRQQSGREDGAQPSYRLCRDSGAATGGGARRRQGSFILLGEAADHDPGECWETDEGAGNHVHAAKPPPSLPIAPPRVSLTLPAPSADNDMGEYRGTDEGLGSHGCR
jgi:hypothetical protein